MPLDRRFTPISLLLLSINGMIGSAWLFAPLYAAKIAGSGAIYSWLIAGFGTATIALTFAELSVLMPFAGGTAQIPQLSHGALTSFILSWIAWLSSLTMAPIEVQAVLQYASIYFPGLMQSHQSILSLIGLCWATVLMLLLCVINVASFNGLMRFNLILFLFKICVIFLTIFSLIKIEFHPENFFNLKETAMSLTGWQSILSAVATGGVAFAFTGFKHGVELAGETKKHALAIPLAIVGSVLCCLLIYLGLQISFIGALSPHSLINGWQHLSFIGDAGPFAGLIGGLGLFWLLKLLYIDAVVSPLGAGLVYVTSTARILYAMSTIGYIPNFLAKLNAKSFPLWAITINFILGMFLFLPLPGWQSMVSFLVSAMVISYAMGPIALLCLRIELPLETRHFKLPFSKIICLLAFYFCNLLSFWTGWQTMQKLSIAIGCGFLFFLVAKQRGKLTHLSINMRSAGWLVPYLSGLILISYLGSFGGKNIIPFGWDFLVIGVFSIVILFLAVGTRSQHITKQFFSMQMCQLQTP